VEISRQTQNPLQGHNPVQVRQPLQEAANDKTYHKPEVEDLFDGSRPKFNDTYNKYIAAVQLPESVAPSEYYNEALGQQQADRYYESIADISDPKARMAALGKLVASSHKPEPKGYDFVVARDLYTKVDRHPDGTVRSVYSREPIQVLKYPDINPETITEKELEAIAGASHMAPEVVGMWMSFKRGAASLNCEHVVPQSMFDKKEPMRSDLHHLFACEVGENSRRGNTPYGNYTPKGGKGEVARATLYFMLRYPDIKLPYGGNKLEMLKEWSAADPPSLHEKRRNQEIEKLQGNRNPFIDHPDWVKDFNR